MPLCCSNCFYDNSRLGAIFPVRFEGLDQCSYCESSEVAVLDPRKLVDYVEFLIGAYKPNSDGKPLMDWFRDDWGLFDHSQMDDFRAKDLLGEILDDREIVRQRFSPAEVSESNRLGDWEDLRQELMYNNRYFPDVDINLDRLEDSLEYLTLPIEHIPRKWYRARIQTDDQKYALNDMGPPPKRLASFGRANPAGIPYLYLGSSSAAAISEVRPHPDELVCVAEFRVPDSLKLADLRNPKRMVSPFKLETPEEIATMRTGLAFLERLGEELSRPVIPRSAAIDYAPSQYFCEFIKKCNFDGVVYRSSVSEGVNIALFDPNKGTADSVAQYRVVTVSVEAEEQESDQTR